MYEKTRVKSFIGGLVIGTVVSAVITAFATSMVWATAFINAGLIK